MNRQKELKLAYKLNPPPAGIFQIKNHHNGKIFIGSTMNLPGKRNSAFFQLKQKVHFNKELQADWNAFGASAFTFDILEVMKREDIPQAEWKEVLSALEEKWLSMQQPCEDKGYNKPSKKN